MENDRLFTTLAFAGAAPFAAVALLSLFAVEAIPAFGNVDDIIGSYAVAIICFLAGTHWAFQLIRPQSTPFDLFISSNVAVVVVWLAYLALDTAWLLAIAAITFIALLAVDYRLHRDGLVSTRYFRARAIATVVATTSLLIVLLNA